MRAVLTFYRTLAVPLLGVSLTCAFLVWQSQNSLFVFRVFWAKVLTSIVIGIFVAIFREEQFTFFNHLGFSRNRLLVSCFLFDFLLWLSMMFVTVALI